MPLGLMNRIELGIQSNKEECSYRVTTFLVKISASFDPFESRNIIIENKSSDLQSQLSYFFTQSNLLK